MPTQQGKKSVKAKRGIDSVVKLTWDLVFNIILTNTVVLGEKDRHRI